MSTVLAIHAHPDDIETLGAGTLALLASKGHRIAIATVTAGDCGSAELGPEETGRIRQHEAAAAAAMIGAEYRCVGLGDLAVFNDDASRRRVTELVRWARPDLVITSAPVDYHPDHEATSLLVRDACFAASAPNYKTGPAAPLDHDDFGLDQAKIMNVIDSKSLERDAGGKPLRTFPHPALDCEPRSRRA